MSVSKTRSTAVGRVLARVVLIVVGTVSALPIAYIILVGFKPDAAFRNGPFDPFVPTLDHFARLLSEPTIYKALFNSVIATTVSTAAAVATSTLAAYALARLKPRGHRAIALLTVAVRMLPPVALVIPLYLASLRSGLLDTLPALILPYTALSIPLAVWMLQGFFLDLPKEIEEAAWIDGCTKLGAFVRVILPLAAPGIAAASIFAFTFAWNDLLIAISLTSFDATTLPVLGSRLSNEGGVDWGGLGALTTLIMIPGIAFTLIMRKHLVGGLAGAAVRG